MPLTLKRWHIPAIVVIASTSLFGLSSFASDKRDMTAIAQNLNQSVAQNARGWLFNHYDAGSLNNMRVVRPDGANGLIVRATYTFNGGQPGWVLARVVGTRVECLQYWDKDGCEPVAAGLSIGVQKGPPIGVQKGPPSSSSVTGMSGAPFALVAA